MPEIHRLGIVAIGRNEGSRLRRCLDSVRDEKGRAVYVDSGSTDGSAELARELGFEVLELEASAPFSAARGRNAGWKFLAERRSDLEFIQFLDGDSELQPGWLETAVAYLQQQPDVAVVWGRLRERLRNKNIYHRLADMEWDTPIGESDYCGGIGMFRVDALRAVGGFDESLAAGEEPELCLRIRRRGDRVMRLAEEMALHDAGMSRLSDWWRRAVRGGRAYAESAWLHGRSLDRYRLREVASILTWGFALPVVALSLAWSTSGLSLAILGLYAALWARIRATRLRRGDSRSDASLYAGACVVTKFAQLLGLLAVVWSRSRGDHGSVRGGPERPGNPGSCKM